MSELNLNTELNTKEQRMLETFNEQITAQMEGKAVTDGVRVKEFLATPSAKILMPRIIVGAVRKAAEPLYLGSKLLKPIRLNQGSTMIFPYIGPMMAYDVAEGQEIPESTPDWDFAQTPQIIVGKSGVRVRVTEEMVNDSQWDIIAMLLEQAGRAMARHKEQKCFRAFSKHGHKVFDNYSEDPNAKTSGLAQDGTLNETLSVEDLLDLIIGVMANEYTPTDLLMHPLAWTVFAKNGLMGSLGFTSESPNASFKLGPESIQGRVPFAFNVNLSPFVPINLDTKRFDVYCVDRNNIGVLVTREDLSTEQFDEPARDILNIKLKERYGIGILNQGRAIAVARGVSMEKSYPEMTRVLTYAPKAETES